MRNRHQRGIKKGNQDNQSLSLLKKKRMQIDQHWKHLRKAGQSCPKVCTTQRDTKNPTQQFLIKQEVNNTETRGTELQPNKIKCFRPTVHNRAVAFTRKTRVLNGVNCQSICPMTTKSAANRAQRYGHSRVTSASCHLWFPARVTEGVPRGVSLFLACSYTFPKQATFVRCWRQATDKLWADLCGVTPYTEVKQCTHSYM